MLFQQVPLLSAMMRETEPGDANLLRPKSLLAQSLPFNVLHELSLEDFLAGTIWRPIFWGLGRLVLVDNGHSGLQETNPLTMVT